MGEWSAASQQRGGAGNHSSFYAVLASCGNTSVPLRLLPRERTLEMRIFSDFTFAEIFFQGGRVAMTQPMLLSEEAILKLLHTGTEWNASPNVVDASVFPIKSIMTTSEAIRKAPRLYNGRNGHTD